LSDCTEKESRINWKAARSEKMDSLHKRKDLLEAAGFQHFYGRGMHLPWKLFGTYGKRRQFSSARRCRFRQEIFNIHFDKIVWQINDFGSLYKKLQEKPL
jgi:hypothetical protein